MSDKCVWFSVEPDCWRILGAPDDLNRFKLRVTGQIDEKLAEDVARQHFISEGYLAQEWPVTVRFYGAESNGSVIARFVVTLDFHPVFRAVAGEEE